MTVVEADWICPVSMPPIRNGCFSFDNGRIVEAPSAAGEGSILRFPGCAVIPGFVNAHTHLELTILRGFLENLDFPSWIRKLTVTKYERLTRDDLLLSARLGAIECLNAGVTTVGEIMDVGTSWEAMVEFGLRGLAHQEVFGPDERQTEKSFTDFAGKVEALRRQETSTRRIGGSPHAPFTVSPPLYQRVRDYCRREGLPMAIHAAESRDEGLFVREGRGFFADHLRSRDIPVEPRGMSPIAFFNHLGMIGRDTVLIHAIDVDDDDLRTLAEGRAPVVHCPKSNAKLGHGIARVTDFLDAGLTVGLGTDSMASNNAVDMFEEMRAAIFFQRARLGSATALPSTAALRMATLGGAECLGLADRVGSLEPGKLADFVVVRLSGAATQPVFDPIDALVFSASRGDITATFLGGEQVLLDTAPLLAEIRNVADRLRL